MNISPKQRNAIIALPGAKRYEHFIKVAADQRKVWGLHAEGWALASTSEGERVFPLWPAREYAELCATGIWDRFRPEEIPLDTLFDILVPKLREARTLVGVFPTPQESAVTPTLEQLVTHLKDELSRIE